VKVYCVSIKDRASENFGNPVFVLAMGQALRSFGDEINRAAGDNPYYQHPDDYDMYLIGEFDTSSGRFVAQDPEMVAIGKNMVIPPKG
jgi:hypothetical protein